jgi:steroid delta-isomerase-like uncharacterized protein
MPPAFHRPRRRSANPRKRRSSDNRLPDCPRTVRRGIHHRQGQVMSNETAEVNGEFLKAFADAWNRHDVEALMSFMSDDCVFESSAGPDVSGTAYRGREAVRAGFAEVWATFPDAYWGNARHFVSGDRGVSEWTFTGTRTDGTRVEVHGCDLFTFRGGKIALKDSYRKQRATAGSALPGPSASAAATGFP